jgi:nucleoside-diphosphate-sugar epimerase
MRVLFTGATGVVGRIAVPLLVASGHDVTAVARSDEARAWLGGQGARPVDLDLFSPDSVAEALSGLDCVVHFATSIPAASMSGKSGAWEMNDRLRREATSNLVDAALAAGATRFVQESITFTYADGGDDWIGEDHPIGTVWEILESALDAEREVARFATGGGSGVVLRMSRLYGPGRASAGYLAMVKDRKVPIVGKGLNWVSHLHVEDAASSVLASLEVEPGTYNVSEDEPSRAAANLAALAEALGAKAPRKVPVAVARTMAGGMAGWLSISHRISNRRFREASGWSPLHGSARDAWPRVVAGSP